MSPVFSSSPLFPEMLVEKSADLRECLFGLGRRGVAIELRVRLAFIDLQHRLDPGLAQLAMHPHGRTEEQIARSGSQDGGRKTLHVAENRREHRVFDIVAIGVERGAGIATPIGRYEAIVDK